MHGVIRTRVGYAGGKSLNPTYRDIGDHSETIQIDFDPTIISYNELLTIFWSSHYPYQRAFSSQYKSIIFYHNQEQKELALESLITEEQNSERKVFTELIPFKFFYIAEDYHQKYYLQQNQDLKLFISGDFTDFDQFVDSTIAARLNGYVGGYGNVEGIKEEIDRLVTSEDEIMRILDYLNIE